MVANSLKSMLEFEEPEKFQESFMINFEVSYQDMFGNECRRELKEDGKNITVTMENRQVPSGHMQIMVVTADCLSVGVCGPLH